MKPVNGEKAFANLSPIEIESAAASRGPLALAAEHTQRIKMGPAVAIAFPRSPMAIAYTAWDLAALSKGRFVLGLGTQVKGHIVDGAVDHYQVCMKLGLRYESK